MRTLFTIALLSSAPEHSRHSQHVFDLANKLVRVAGFVVVPCEYFYQIPIHNLRKCQIDDARVRIADDVRGDNLVFAYSEDIFVSIGRRLLSKYGIEFVDACPATRHECDVGDRTDRNRNSKCNAIELSGVFRQDYFVVAIAAPVVFGTMFSAAALPRRS